MPVQTRKRPRYRYIPNPTPFGILVKRWREKQGWSQVELGYRAHLDGSHISQLETGHRGYRSSAEVVWAIARALDAPVYEFLKAAGWLEPFRDFVNNDPNLTAAQRRVLIRLYDSWMREG